MASHAKRKNNTDGDIGFFFLLLLNLMVDMYFGATAATKNQQHQTKSMCTIHYNYIF